MKELKISIYAVTGTEIRSLRSSIMHPEINLEEMLKEVWDHLSLSTIMVSGPTGNCHGNDLTSTKLTVLMSVDQGVPIQWSDTKRQNTGWTRGRMWVEDKMMEDLSVILKRGGTLCKMVEQTPWCSASKKERRVLMQEHGWEDLDHTGFRLAHRNHHMDFLMLLIKSKVQHVDPSWRITIRIPTVRGTKKPDLNHGWATDPEVWKDLCQTSTWIPKCLVRECWNGTLANQKMWQWSRRRH